MKRKKRNSEETKENKKTEDNGKKKRKKTEKKNGKKGSYTVPATPFAKSRAVLENRPRLRLLDFSPQPS